MPTPKGETLNNLITPQVKSASWAPPRDKEIFPLFNNFPISRFKVVPVRTHRHEYTEELANRASTIQSPTTPSILIVNFLPVQSTLSESNTV